MVSYKFRYDNNALKLVQKNYDIIDEAWDIFLEYVGQHDIKTPIDLKEFDSIFEEIINKSGKFTEFKTDILESFRYDSYSWPLVKR